MSRPFVSVYASIADRKTVEIDNDLLRMNEAQQQADTLSAQTKTVNENGAVSVLWSSPQQLRTWAEKQETVELLFQSALHRGAVRSRLLFRAYQHAAWCSVRSAVYALQDTMKLSLSQVAALFTTTPLVAAPDPPGLLLSCSVLATCHASNAPGLSPVARYWQVRPEE